MGKEKNSQFYDQVYRQGGGLNPFSKTHKSYFQNPHKSPYYPVWRRALAFIPKSKSFEIADFGCGPGQFAQLVTQYGYKYSYGVDFSPVAVRMARERNPKLKDCFRVANLYEPECYRYRAYDVAVFIEVLEHIEYDRKVLSFLDPGVRVIFTVPNYDSEGHVRVYPDETTIKQRYQDILEIKRITRHFLEKKSTDHSIYICKAVKV